MKTSHERQYGRDESRDPDDFDPAIGGDLAEVEQDPYVSEEDLGCLEFGYQVEMIMKDLRSMSREDLEVHLRASNIVSGMMQVEAGHLLWISEWDPQCGCGWYSYCGKYTVGQDGCKQWAYTPEDVACFRAMCGMEYCELHFQAKRLGRSWDESSWDRFRGWLDSIEATSGDPMTDLTGLGRMRKWLSSAES